MAPVQFGPRAERTVAKADREDLVAPVIVATPSRA